MLVDAGDVRPVEERDVVLLQSPLVVLDGACAANVGRLLLHAFEARAGHRWLQPLATLGAAPMFFYVLHLYVLKFMYLAAVAVWGTNQGQLFGLDHLLWLWVLAAVLAVALYPAVRWFAALKQRRRDLAWLKYL